MQLLPGISVVIPNYNGQELLPLVVPPALVAVQQTGLSFELIIADDASTDGSVALVRERFPQVQLLTATINRGFSATANAGINAARYDWVLLLNSDVILTPDYFASLLRYRALPGVLGVCGRMTGWDDDAVQEAGKYPVFQGAKIKTSYDYIPKTTDRSGASWPCFYLSGANAFMNKAVVDRIGGFNELFSPFYAEDAELSLRAWRLGYASYYEHHAVCRHRLSSTILSSQKKKRVDRIYDRNKFLLHALHLGGLYLLSWWFQLLIELLFRLLTFRPGFLLSLIDFIKKLPQVRESRRALRNLQPEKRPVSVPDVFRHITAQLPLEQITIFKR